MKHIATHIGLIALALFVAGCPHTKPISVRIGPNGAITVAGRPCSESQLVAQLSELGARNHQGVVIRADPGAPFKQVVAVMEACKVAGVEPVVASMPSESGVSDTLPPDKLGNAESQGAERP